MAEEGFQISAAELSVEVNGETQEVTLAAPGVYDPDKQLSNDEIVAMKEVFKEDGLWGEKIPSVCTHIVINMLAQSAQRDGASKPGRIREWWQRRRAATLNPELRYEYGTPEKFARYTGMIAAHWALTLQWAISMPGGEWPEGMTPPATFAEALKAVEDGRE